MYMYWCVAGDFDYVFWFGDLNYRVDMERSTVDQYIQQWQHHQQDGWLVSTLLHSSLSHYLSLSLYSLYY